MVREYINLLEARKEGIEYKEEKVKGELDRVIAVLEGKDSGVYTRMAKKYRQIDRLTKLMAKKRGELNEQAKSSIEKLFDAEDEVLTRVVDTVSLTITLSKQTVTPEKSAVNYEKVVEELLELMPELEDKINSLRSKYTVVVGEKVNPPKLMAPKIKDTLDDVKNESLNEGINAFFKWASAIYSRIMNWANNYDKKLEAIASKI